MDVLIKNMEMPNKCSECQLWLPFLGRYLCFGQGNEIDHEKYPYEFMENNRLPNCPLVAVPPHGRLIDADELEAGEAIDLGKETWDMVHNAPTILEASNE